MNIFLQRSYFVMGKVTSKERNDLTKSTRHNSTDSDEIDPLITNTDNDDKLLIEINGDASVTTSNNDEKLFKSKREMLILLALSLAIFSVTCCESILAPFYEPEVSSILS